MFAVTIVCVLSAGVESIRGGVSWEGVGVMILPRGKQWHGVNFVSADCFKGEIVFSLHRTRRLCPSQCGISLNDGPFVQNSDCVRSYLLD